jgi:hypothetical protein
MSGLRAPGRVELVLLIALLTTLVAAPTPGDVGGCGQPAQQLDPRVFFASKLNIDCRRCQECELPSGACAKACDTSTPIPEAFPDHCYPLVHDGEVCLRALFNASCGDYEKYMDDQAPSTPSECNFCPPR